MPDNPAKRNPGGRRVTAKGAASGNPAVRARSATTSGPSSSRYTPPDPRSNKLPSPWWVPAVMFGLLGAGALIIILNYLGVIGSVSNVKLVIGLVMILGGIVAATQYR